ncbi:cytokinin dehydrogenase 6 [Elaeis guineensis]|uniref:cytokinin dehydrogenase n=1 Tax=Elaeis guineensis var. tenera TaxID=51953 RepID=A0A6J0PS86_ELAGV|nr:cytokinin dehydrogenase 6 [Elaeis guineensis]XP_029116158.1 cytokinin dehydrogenase 6 [Elaeis guineensis]
MIGNDLTAPQAVFIRNLMSERKAQWSSILARELEDSKTISRIQVDDDAITNASTDFGGIIKGRPLAIYCPSSEDDIARLVRRCGMSSELITVTARGRGHSDRGQSVGDNGITIDMRSLARSGYRRRINVSSSGCPAPFADVGAEQMWSEVMHETLRHGLSPRTWLDYLDLTVGGSLSVGGISGQTFRHGPQVSNVYELDVITGNGELVTCSEHLNSDLFYAALGGLGQFGVITRARIALEPAPTKVKWVGLVYSDFEAFTKDEEYLISLDGNPGKKKGFNYLEGFLITSSTMSWRSPFFSKVDVEKIHTLLSMHEEVYVIEATIDYDDDNSSTIDQDLDSITEGLKHCLGFKFTKDLSYVQFLDRVREEEKKLREVNFWDVPHPWINMLVPKSRIYDFHEGVFRGIFQQHKPTGVILCYPLGKDKFDGRMSLMFPEEEVFYKIGLLLSTTPDDLDRVLKQIDEMLGFCDQNGIGMKQYMPHYEKMEDWMKHFGSKWEWFVEMKKKYDPKVILAPGQKIFTCPLAE